MPDRRSRATGGLVAVARLLAGHLAPFRNPRLQDVATGTLRSGSDGRTWALSVLNCTLRARQLLTYAFYLRPRSALSRIRFVPPPPAPRLGLSLLCPSRERAALAATFLRSVLRTAAEPARVEVLFYVDRDDPALPAYEELHRRQAAAGPGRCELVVGDPVGVPGAWNALAAAAQGDLLLMANDDQVYVDHGWDLRLDHGMAQLVSEHPDGVCCLYFEAGQYPEGAADFPVLSRAWYRALGYFTPEIFQQWEVETWIFDLARRIGRLVAVPGVFVEHRHYQEYKAPFDATYQRHRVTREKSISDHALFLRTAHQRAEHAEALRRAMAESDRPRPWFVEHLRRQAGHIGREVDGTRQRAAVDGLPLYERGRRVEAVCAAVPVTAGVVAAIPEATTFGPGVVTLRWLEPGCAVGPAPTGAVRVVLGVRTPLDAPGLPPEGQCVVMDGRPLRNGATEPSVLLVIDAITGGPDAVVPGTPS